MKGYPSQERAQVSPGSDTDLLKARVGEENPVAESKTGQRLQSLLIARQGQYGLTRDREQRA